MCLTPIMLKKETWKQKLQDTYHMQQVPCGKCIECLKLRVNSWYVRLMTEKNSSESALFITLTYDDDHLNFTDNGSMCLNYKDTQDFWKRLRKRNKSKTIAKIRYFLVGEYGSQTHRPHYHAIVFNIFDPQDVQECWTQGSVHIGKVQSASVFYTLKYALKRASKIRKDSTDDRAVEKALMSRGLGIDFLSDDMVAYFKEDVSRPVTMLGDVKLPLPRYYRDKIFTDSEKRARNLKLLPHADKRLDKRSSPLFPQRVEKMYSDQEKKAAKTD